MSDQSQGEKTMSTCEPLPTVIVPAQPGWTIWHYEDNKLVKTPVAAWEVIDVRDTDDLWPTFQAFPITHNAAANNNYKSHEGVLCDPNGSFSQSLEFFRDENDALAYARKNVKWREAENAKINILGGAP
jgi:hypothetical protein